jgi:hypothetical protein
MPNQRQTAPGSNQPHGGNREEALKESELSSKTQSSLMPLSSIFLPNQ